MMSFPLHYVLYVQLLLMNTLSFVVTAIKWYYYCYYYVNITFGVNKKYCDVSSCPTASTIRSNTRRSLLESMP